MSAPDGPNYQWVTNGLIGLLILVVSGFMVVLRDSYIDLSKAVRDQSNAITRIEAKIEAVDSMQARIVALELAVARLQDKHLHD